MSNAVKTIVGIALIVTAPYLATEYFALTAGTLAYTLTVAGITLVGSSIYGSAQTPEASDFAGVEAYAGQKLQTQKTNTSAVPQIYGENRMAGNIIWQDTGTQINGDSDAKGKNRDYWGIYVLCGHEINDITEVYGEEISLTDQGSNRFTDDYVQIIWYQASSSTTNLQSVYFPTANDSSSSQNGQYLSLPSITIPANVTYVAVHQVFDAEGQANTRFANLNFVVEGKKIRTITDASTISSTTSYSNNPAEVMLDLLGEALSVEDSEIDISAFYDAKTQCTNNGWSCNYAIMQQANIQSIVADVMGSCRGQIHHCLGEWKFDIDKSLSQNSLSVVRTLDESDIVNNSLNISMRGNRDISNKIIAKWVNPSDNWLTAQSVHEDTTLQTLDGQTIERNIDLKACTNSAQADELAEISLNTLRYSEDGSGNRVRQTPLIVSFTTTVKNADLEINDVITLSHDLLDRDRDFLILSIENDQSGLIKMTGREYAETHYKDSSGTYLI